MIVTWLGKSRYRLSSRYLAAFSPITPHETTKQVMAYTAQCSVGISTGLSLTSRKRRFAKYVMVLHPKPRHLMTCIVLLHPSTGPLLSRDLKYLRMFSAHARYVLMNPLKASWSLASSLHASQASLASSFVCCAAKIGYRSSRRSRNTLH